MSKSKFFVSIGAVMCAVLMFAVGIMSSGFTNWDWLKPGTGTPTDDYVVVGDDFDGTKVYPMSKNVLFASSGLSVSPLTLTANVEPLNATNKAVTWALAWVNPSATWAVGKTVTDYITITPNGLTCSVTCKQAFGAQIKLTVASAEDKSITVSSTFDYVKRITAELGLQLNSGGTIRDVEYDKDSFDIDLLNNKTYSFSVPEKFCGVGTMMDTYTVTGTIKWYSGWIGAFYEPGKTTSSLLKTLNNDVDVSTNTFAMPSTGLVNNTDFLKAMCGSYAVTNNYASLYSLLSFDETSIMFVLNLTISGLYTGTSTGTLDVETVARSMGTRVSGITLSDNAIVF